MIVLMVHRFCVHRRLLTGDFRRFEANQKRLFEANQKRLSTGDTPAEEDPCWRAIADISRCLYLPQSHVPTIQGLLRRKAAHHPLHHFLCYLSMFLHCFMSTQVAQIASCTSKKQVSAVWMLVYFNLSPECFSEGLRSCNPALRHLGRTSYRVVFRVYYNGKEIKLWKSTLAWLLEY
jgi:hypothetical protein